ncbi:MAG: retroviral-like aspartic protease family protein [Desulfobacterales bacterium]|nr:MAG: retroviral-like aspartic protease family protein [Desulfobacterales bacterium]
MADNDLKIILPESDDVLTCPKCKTANPLESNFCLNCGTRLHRRSRSNFRWRWILILLVCFAGLLYYFRYHRTAELEPKKLPAEILPAETPLPPNAVVEVPKDVKPQKEEAIELKTPTKIKIPVGTVVIKDITGKIIKEVPVPVVGGGWVALPKQVCLGAAEWILKIEPDLEVSIVGGVYSDYDRIGLWRIMEDFRIEGPELHPWSTDAQLAWLPLTSLDSPEPIEIENPNEQGHFIEGSLAGDFNENGILMQQDRTVGWTFGDNVEGAFLWNGDEGRYLRPEIRVDDFYRITFANGREEELVRALAMGADYSDLERLEALANVFRFAPKLSVKMTPAHLQTTSAVENIKKLAEKALKSGINREVADIFDSQILIEAADVQLLMIVAQATVQSYGFEGAIELTENVADGLSALNEQDLALLNEIFSELYQNWISTLFNQGNLQAAWRAYRSAGRKLPDDLNVHLMGVQLALAENNWAEAEELLAMKEYPAELKDKIQNLQNQISELKAQEGKIVIEFTPGSRQIPVTAVLNRNTYQNFIVDTGASMVTIPRATALELGLSIDSRNPMRKIFTASGVQYAPEVNLYAITIEGWEVNNIKALVLDIPNQPDLGLLGLNYLQRFRMDMNTEAGVLLLEPR